MRAVPSVVLGTDSGLVRSPSFVSPVVLCADVFILFVGHVVHGAADTGNTRRVVHRLLELWLV